MNRRRNLLITAAAALLSGALVYGIDRLQALQLERREMVSVVVPKRFIGAGERIRDGDLGYRLIPKDVYNGEMLVDAGEVSGMETVMPLGANEPLLDWKVDRYNLLPRESQSTFQIPQDYILSISNGIRAGDKVVLYLSGESAPSQRLFAETITVASVKSSSNVEIDNLEDSNLLSLAEGDKERMYASRRDANGMIDYINLNLTEAQWLAVDAACKDGTAKLVIAYSPETMELGAKGEGAAP